MLSSQARVARSLSATAERLVKCFLTSKTNRGVASGGISVYISPKSVTVLFTCGTLTHVLKFQ